jgi:hydrogenase maturation protein HypF
MAKNFDAAAKLTAFGADEARLLQGIERPIVLLRKRSGHGLAENIAPGNRDFGVMLPYTPLHHLLLQHFRALVMTSANLSDEPIAFEDDDARRRLAAIADAFLLHNRRIHIRTDDSIARVMADRPLLLRRSRGFVPRAVALPGEISPVLAVGAELKNTICLTRGDRAFLSQHVGDLKNLEVYDSFRNTIRHLQTLLEVEPQRVAHDLHPDYYSTRYAREESGLSAVAVQHHHAHLASCLAEHGVREPAIGVIFDGIGFGDDGHIWGGEFLVGDLKEYQRLGHLKYQPMPGGDLATKEPWRMALSYLHGLFGEVPGELHCFADIAEPELRLVCQAMVKRINTPLTSSCGRLFDAVASIIGLRQVVSFEGQAAMELEMLADPGQTTAYPCSLSRQDGQIICDPALMIEAIVNDHLSAVGAERIAGRFHLSLAVMIEEACAELHKQTGLAKVVLSGGVFQNCLLTGMVVSRLEKSGLTVLTHSLVPPNDGGLALGQAVVAASQVFP